MAGSVVALLLGLFPVVAATPASAAGESALITISPTAPAPQPSGSPTTYSIQVACQGTAGASCGGGSDSTITIPLTGTNTPPADMSSWGYSATSGSAGLVTSGPNVVPNGSGGFNLVLTLANSIFVAGYSGSITLQVTPPNDTTPNHTTWSLDPTLTGGNITPVTVPTPATGEATARPSPVITKFTGDGGSVYVAGSTVTYDLTATCTTNGNGDLNMTDGSLTDPLPAGLTYVSSTPPGAVVVGQNVTWNFPTSASTPTGCAPGATGPNDYQIVATVPTPAPPPGGQPLRNIATFAGEGPDATQGTVSGSTDAEADIDVVDTAPGGTCATAGCPTITKTSLAPLAISSLPGNQYEGTYPGDWVTPSATPTYTVGAASGSFQATVHFPLTGTYETDVVDPLPCLSNLSGVTYSSLAPTAPACTDPAFHTTVFEVTGPGLATAIADGWQPSEVTSTGAVVALTASSATGDSAYYTTVGTVANVHLPVSPFLEGNALVLTLWGYADATLTNLDVLQNTATATPQLAGVPLAPIAASADLLIVGPTPQLGVSKSFGTLGAGPGGTTLLNLKGAVNTPAGLTNDVVLTDLLPSGMGWSNVAAGGAFVLSGTTNTTAPATVTYLTNYKGTGRNLIRATIPASNFATSGSWTIAPPTNFFELTTPTALGTYANTDQLFLSGIGTANPLNPDCTTPTQTTGGTTAAALESYNPLDLAGDGNVQEDYCQNGATLVVQPSGAAFSLTKTVQGDADVADNVPPKGALGIGDATLGGNGTYTLNWTNVGSDTLGTPVIYDILPFVGDTGVSAGQATTARGSQFAPVFDSVGPLPAGVTVEYSQSTNPCRTEVYAAAPGCVDDWTATEPAPSSVRALEFVSSATYAAGTGFSVSLTVDVPNNPADANLVAWNSAATNAVDVSNPSTITLPAEPPKVGLVAPTGTTPNVSTTTTETSLPAYSSTPVDDSVTITGTGGQSGSLAWSFVGPAGPGGRRLYRPHVDRGAGGGVGHDQHPGRRRPGHRRPGDRSGSGLLQLGRGVHPRRKHRDGAGRRRGHRAGPGHAVPDQPEHHRHAALQRRAQHVDRPDHRGQLRPLDRQRRPHLGHPDLEPLRSRHTVDPR